jgi:hypothetical protein
MTEEHIRLTRICTNGRYGISRGNGSAHYLGPGIADPLPGWQWVLGRDHPLVELRMSIESPGCRNSFSINGSNKNSDKILREVCSVALKR